MTLPDDEGTLIPPSDAVVELFRFLLERTWVTGRASTLPPKSMVHTYEHCQANFKSLDSELKVWACLHSVASSLRARHSLFAAVDLGWESTCCVQSQ